MSLTRLLVVLAVALQSFGALRDIHASHAHATADAAIAAACLDPDAHPHEMPGHGERDGLPADTDEDCPTCDLLAVFAKGWIVTTPAIPALLNAPVAIGADRASDLAPSRCWAPARSRGPPTNTICAV